MSGASSKLGSKLVITVIVLIVAVLSAGIAALMLNIFERKVEAKDPSFRLVEVTETDTDPEKWTLNWHNQYDSYKKTRISTLTRSG